MDSPLGSCLTSSIEQQQQQLQRSQQQVAVDSRKGPPNKRGHQWGHLCADILIVDGFEQSKAEPCIFRKVVDGVVVMIVGVYVDDLLVGGSEEDCESLLASLNKKFPTNNPGKGTWYDGCGIERDAELGTIKLSQEAYVEILMKRFDVQSISDITASPGADLVPKQDDEPGGD